MKTVTFEHREYYDNLGTGNYTEDKSKRYPIEVAPERAEQFVEFWMSTGFTHYETSKAHFFEKHLDASRYTQFIFYK